MGSLKRGALIVIEGVDRSGKSTQCRELVKSLIKKNINAQLINFPDRSTQIGHLISEYLKDKENELCDEAIHLLFTANRWEKKAEMKKLLESGITLIVDRYSYSGIVYSSIKKNMKMEWCKQPENGLFKPDLVFLLTLSEQKSVTRPGYGEERYENEEFQSKVAKEFLKMSQEDDEWEVVKADGPIEEIHQTILGKTLKTIDEVSCKPFKYLKFNPHT